ncbi:hypothetical protein HGRIS_008731 [Hohenbuehelia grisea]|uniref:F-box domain-containing protein n=1 Tax=Hohenbuehelia grisea TaxID=104357 RepID=A0ABR3J8T0_9AGAR
MPKLQVDEFPIDQASYPRHRCNPKAPASIVDLPFELLIDIFNLVYAHSIIGLRRARKDDPHNLWKEHTLSDPSLFPFNVAGVCLAWKRVASGVPAFWTRVVSFVDDDWEAVTVREQLEWSKGLPFRVTLTRRDDTKGAVHMQEAQRVKVAMQALGSHLERCVELNVHVAQSSSLPSVIGDIAGSAPLLMNLRLRSTEDDGRRWHIDRRNQHSQERETRIRGDLDIDGWNLLSACVSDAQRLRGFKRLCVTNYRAALRGGQTFPMDVFIHAIAQLTDLRAIQVEHVDFSSIPRDSWPTVSFPTSLTSLSLKGLSSEALEGLFGAVSYNPLDSLRIEKCSFTRINGVSIPSSETLELRGIVDTTSDLQGLFCAWNGTLLTIANSSLLLGGFVQVLGTQDMARPETPFSCNRLRQLFIAGSPIFDVDALKDMVAHRNMQFLTYDDANRVIFPGDFQIDGVFIREIHVADCGDEPAQEDTDWLKAHLPRFSWSLGKDWIY